MIRGEATESFKRGLHAFGHLIIFPVNSNIYGEINYD